MGAYARDGNNRKVMMIFLIFAFILGLLIVVHEAGHFLMARRLGVRVEEFAFGFGPKRNVDAA